MFSYEYCKIFKNSFFYRQYLVAACGIDIFLVSGTYNFKIFEVVRQKYNLMISSSVGSDHPGKYSYEITHEYL